MSSTVSLRTQGKLLARFLREKGLAALTHTQAIEALAHAQNFPSHNAYVGQSNKHPGSSWEALKAQLQEGIRTGEITIGAVLNALAETQGPEHRFYAEAARSLEDEGTLEIDDSPIVSLSDDGGAYVMSWSWVYRPSDQDLPENPAVALLLGYEYVGISEEAEEGYEGVASKDLKLNLPALRALASGESLPEDLMVLEGPSEMKVVWTVGHLKSLAWNPKGLQYRGLYQGKSLILEFSNDPL